MNKVLGVGWGQDDAVDQRECFHDLPEEEQRLLRRATVPSYEYSVSILRIAALPGKLLFNPSCLGMNMQSKGTVRLGSVDPADAPIIDSRLLSHSFDRLNVVQDARRVLNWLKLPMIAEKMHGPIQAPASGSDEDIWDFVEKYILSAYHPCGTVKMGKRDDPLACVDSDFVVRGFSGLKVVDLSIAPFVPNCHTTPTAYWLGELGAEKLAKNYKLNE